MDASNSVRADHRRPAGILACAGSLGMTRSAIRAIGVTTFAASLAAFITWPQVLHLRTSIFSHHDPYFSIWRITWVAHALATSPLHLFDANIFYPSRDTLAYS